MSGGSFEYLCGKDFDDHDDLLLKMAEALRRRGYEDAAEATKALMYHGPSEELRGVWQAVEWVVSGDWGEHRIREPYEKWKAAQA